MRRAASRGVPSWPKREGVYEFIERVLKSQQCRRIRRGQKGIVRRFLVKTTGLSRARPNFPRRYTAADITLLAGVDAAQEDLSGPAARRVRQREYDVFGKVEYKRLAGISVSHIYNLRRSTVYRNQRVRVHHTQARQVGIAERRKPDPGDRPGYLRMDTAQQGNRAGRAGLFHIHAVDTVTQWEGGRCVEAISERYLMPVWEAMFHPCAFLLLGFHCDNGPELIHRFVARLLEKLMIGYTQSRAYRTTDNALVEGKNGTVIRKHIGYGAIPAEPAEAFQKFYTAQFNPYLNYHRRCGLATIQVLPKEKRQRRYPVEDYRTPYEKLVSLPKWEQYLKPGHHCADAATASDA